MTQNYSNEANAMNTALEAQFVKKNNTTGLLKNDGTVDTSTHLKSTAIVDNLTTNDSTKPLSAKQGKALNDLIGDISTIINGSGS